MLKVFMYITIQVPYRTEVNDTSDSYPMDPFILQVDDGKTKLEDHSVDHSVFNDSKNIIRDIPDSVTVSDNQEDQVTGHVVGYPNNEDTSSQGLVIGYQVCEPGDQNGPTVGQVVGYRVSDVSVDDILDSNTNNDVHFTGEVVSDRLLQPPPPPPTTTTASVANSNNETNTDMDNANNESCGGRNEFLISPIVDDFSSLPKSPDNISTHQNGAGSEEIGPATTPGGYQNSDNNPTQNSTTQNATTQNSTDIQDIMKMTSDTTQPHRTTITTAVTQKRKSQPSLLKRPNKRGKRKTVREEKKSSQNKKKAPEEEKENVDGPDDEGIKSLLETVDNKGQSWSYHSVSVSLIHNCKHERFLPNE